MIVHLGFDCYVPREAVVAVLPYAGHRIERVVRQAREAGRVLDATRGRKTRSVLRLVNGDILLSATTAEAIARRLGRVEAADAGD